MNKQVGETVSHAVGKQLDKTRRMLDKKQL